jgi:hypothetical protein
MPLYTDRHYIAGAGPRTRRPGGPRTAAGLGGVAALLATADRLLALDTPRALTGHLRHLLSHDRPPRKGRLDPTFPHPSGRTAAKGCARPSPRSCTPMPGRGARSLRAPIRRTPYSAAPPAGAPVRAAPPLPRSLATQFPTNRCWDSCCAWHTASTLLRCAWRRPPGCTPTRPPHDPDAAAAGDDHKDRDPVRHRGGDEYR